MDALRVVSVLPFVPSGVDYDGSRRLFAQLGFEETWEDNGYCGFRNGAVSFILQNLVDQHFASNLMLRLNVEDLDAWFDTVSAKQLDVTFPGFRINPPKTFPWGREVHFIDLAGVCWHVGPADG